MVVQGGRSYEQYDSGTVAGKYMSANRQPKQLTGDETADGKRYKSCLTSYAIATQVVYVKRNGFELMELR